MLCLITNVITIICQSSSNKMCIILMKACIYNVFNAGETFNKIQYLFSLIQFFHIVVYCESFA